jgi:hypothetical protein
VSIIEELLGWKSSGSGLEIRDYGHKGSEPSFPVNMKSLLLFSHIDSEISLLK